MALADTAKLIASLELQDRFTPTARKVAGSLGQLETGFAKTGTRLRSIEAGIGNAAATFRARISGMIGAIGPLLGVAGVAGIGYAFANSIEKANEFGFTVSKVTSLTKLTTEQASALVDTLDKYGISGDTAVNALGMLQKNLGNIAVASGGAAKFAEKYGLSITDASGRVLDANALLLRAADYYTSNAEASQKAAAMAKLFGRSWQQLIPILALGADGLREEEESAIKLTAAQLKSMEQFKIAQRDFADAIGDLQVKIGAELLPLITSGLKALSSWVDRNGDRIVAFVRDAAKFAGEVVEGLQRTVLPVFQGIVSGWNSLPPELRDILVKGFIADRTIKFLFGFDPAKAAIKFVGEGLLGTLGQGLLGRGSPANPVFTKEVGLSGVGGPLGGATGAAGQGRAGALLTLGTVALAGVSIYQLGQTWAQVSADANAQAKQVGDTTNQWLRQAPKREDLVRGLAAVDAGLAELNGTDRSPIGLLRSLVGYASGTVDELTETRASIVAALAALDAGKPVPGRGGGAVRAPGAGTADAIPKLKGYTDNLKTAISKLDSNAADYQSKYAALTAKLGGYNQRIAEYTARLTTQQPAPVATPIVNVYVGFSAKSSDRATVRWQRLGGSKSSTSRAGID